jgi:hypothetical protein
LRAKTVRFFSGKNGKIGNCDKGEKKTEGCSKEEEDSFEKGKELGKRLMFIKDIVVDEGGSWWWWTDESMGPWFFHHQSCAVCVCVY